MKSDGMNIALNLSLPDFLLDINTLEQACRELARVLFVASINALDDALLANSLNGIDV